MFNKVYTSAIVVSMLCCSALYSTALSASEEGVSNQTIDDIHDPFYIGLGAGSSFLKPETNSTALSLSQDSDFAYKIFGGYQFNDNWAAELFWSELGDAEISSTTNVVGVIKYQAFGAGGIFQYPVSQSVDLFATAGLGRLRNDFDVSNAERVEDSFVYAGGGIMWNFADTWDLRAEYDNYDSDAQLLTLNIVKRFGSSTNKRITSLENKVDQNNRAINNGIVAAGAVTTGAITAAPVKHETCDDFAVELRGVEFANQSIDLNSKSKKNLDAVAVKMKSLPEDVHFEIRAHTDDTGTELYNYSLSLARARNVRDYLSTKGIALDRIEAHGYGEWRPVQSNATAAGRSANRRAELVVYGLDKYVENTKTCPASSEALPVIGVDDSSMKKSVQ